MFYIVADDTLDPAWWQLLAEFLLHKEPLRLDMVVIRLKHEGTPPEPTQLRTVFGNLRAHNLVHLKGSTDELEADDALQLVEYVAGYMRSEDVHDTRELAVRVVAPSLTPRFARALAPWGSLTPTALAGVHDGAIGTVALRVVETNVACEHAHEELLTLFSPRFLQGKHLAPPVDAKRRALYNRLYRSIEQLARSPEARMTADIDLARQRLEEDVLDDVADLLSIVKHPDRALRKLKPEDRLAGLRPEDRLAGLRPEDRLADLPAAQAVLALPDEVLRALSPEYIASLPADVQSTIRTRLQRT